MSEVLAACITKQLCFMQDQQANVESADASSLMAVADKDWVPSAMDPQLTPSGQTGGPSPLNVAELAPCETFLGICYGFMHAPFTVL